MDSPLEATFKFLKGCQHISDLQLDRSFCMQLIRFTFLHAKIWSSFNLMSTHIYLINTENKVSPHIFYVC